MQQTRFLAIALLAASWVKPTASWFNDNSEEELLTVFGLSSRPRPTKTAFVPQLMLDLYNNQLPDDPQTSQLKHWLETSDTVRSFQDQQSSDNGLGERRTVHLHFDTSSLPADELVNRATLRICRQSVQPLRWSKTQNKNSFIMRVSVYDVLQPEPSLKTRLLDSKVVDIRQSLWDSLDITAAVQRWRNESVNHGLMVKARGQFMVPKDHVRLRRSLVDTDATWTVHRPYMIVFSTHPRGAPGGLLRHNQSQRRRRRRSIDENRRKRQSAARPSHRCRRHPLYVDFSEIGWNDWIVAPKGYHAYYCGGQCPFPLADSYNATNHAVVQSLLHSSKPSAVPGPCCVATKLSEISLLYIDDKETTVLKRYEDMVVDGCGCR